MIDPECPGVGTCHGCLDWCPICGEAVRSTCDFPECDVHIRIPELEEMKRDHERNILRLRAELEEEKQSRDDCVRSIRFANSYGNMVSRPVNWKIIKW